MFSRDRAMLLRSRIETLHQDAEMVAAAFVR